MNNLDFTVSDIKDIMNTFGKSNLGSMVLLCGDFTLKLEAKTHLTAGSPALTAAPAAVADVAATAPPPDAKITGIVVKSPIVGTFYASPAPDKAPFVSVGDRVEKGDVLFIIESMKLMNEVPSEFDGVISQVLVDNATPVEYGQPILVIE